MIELVTFDTSQLKKYAEEIFPPSHQYDPDGFVASGGHLSVDMLLIAYAAGIFPWYSDDSPILWWSPDPRFVLFPGEFRVSKSLRKKIRDQVFDVRFDTCFDDVIEACASVQRADQPGTWITKEMTGAYKDLHRAGYAHSVEAFHNGKLAGGLYGVSLGNAFFGESMFHRETDASKVALYYLVELAISWGFEFIDSQVPTDHLTSLGARNISRNDYLRLLEKGMKGVTRKGSWAKKEEAG
ncbi:MAG: leucyl/phenylalanyl-tRNA--protein transferase [Bacteroidales bacterium]